jgi:hypothetical protein
MANLLSTIVSGRLSIGSSTATPYLTTAPDGIVFGGNEVGNAYRLYTDLENYGGNYTKLNIAWHTGIKIGAYYGYGGTRFYNNSPSSGTEIFSVGKGDNHVRVENNLYVGNTIYNNGNAVIHTGNIGSQSVNYASSAGSVAWGNVSGKPSLDYQQEYTFTAPPSPDGSGYVWIRMSMGGFNGGGNFVKFSISRAIGWNGASPYGGPSMDVVAYSREWHGGQEGAVITYAEHGSVPGSGFITNAGPRDLAGGGYWFYMRVWAGIDYAMRVYRGSGPIGTAWEETTDPTRVYALRTGVNNIGDVHIGFNTNGDVYGSRFYDYNDTAYYGDFHSRSVLNSLQLGSAASDTSNLKLDVQGNMAIRGSNGLYFGVSTNNYNSWTTKFYASGSTQYFNAQSFIFDNQGYGGTTFVTINGSGIYNNFWYRNYGNQGMYNESYGTHFYSSTGAAWNITGSGGNIELRFRSNHESTIRGYVYADTSNQIGFLNNGGGWNFRTDSNKNAFIHGVELTINADGAGYSNIIMKDGDEGDRVIHCNSNRIGFLNQSGGWGSWCNDDGSFGTDYAMYSPIFYDSNDTGYYGNFASFSRMSEIGVTNHYVYNYDSIESGRTTAEFGSVGKYVATRNAVGDYPSFSFEHVYGTFAWGQIARFHIRAAGQDRPSIQFSSGSSNDRWNIGFCTGVDNNFRISQNMGYRPDNSGVSDGWGTERFRINTDGSIYISSSLQAYSYQGHSNVAGTGNASYHPSGIYSTGTNWLYGTMYMNNNSIRDVQEIYNNGWFRTVGHQGLYNPTNDAHFYPNNASYGSWRIDGTRNGWHGLHFNSGSTLMMNSAETGIHREGYGWQFRWYNGSMYVSRGTYGGGTEYTVIDSGTIGSQSVNYATSAGSSSSSSRSSALDIVGYGSGNMTYYQSSGTFAGQSGWAGYFISNHGDGATYYNQTIIMPFWGAPQYSRLQGGTLVGPYTFWTTENLNDYAPNMNQYVRTSDNVTFNTTTAPTILVNNHSDNTKGYRIHNTSGSSVSAMFTNSSNQLVIAAGAVDQINLNKKVYVNGVALGVNVSPSATAGRIDASNDIVAYSSSDERLKYNITPIENAIDKVKSLTGVEFDWKPEYKHAHGYEGHDTGIIAQQVQEVIPSAVRTNDTGFLAVRYEKLIGLLIEANKELAARVEELEKKLG